MMALPVIRRSPDGRSARAARGHDPCGEAQTRSPSPLPAGAVAVIEVSPLMVNEAAAVVPNVTAVAPRRRVPRDRI
jgi:hypothetical protein